MIMMIYDTEKMQHIANENNGMYSNEVEQKIKKFKERLKFEIEDVFKYYHIRVYPSSIEDILENFDASIKNSLGYKKIMIIISDAIGEIRTSKQDPNQILTESFNKQKQTNNKIDMTNIYIELARRFKMLEVDSRIIDELLSLIKKDLVTLQNGVQDLTDQYIKTNEKQISTLGHEISGTDDIQNPIVEVTKRCQTAINDLDEKKAIEFLQNEFSMLDNKQINDIILNIMSQLPFGAVELEEYLKNEQKRINAANSSLNEVLNLLK